MPQLPRDTTPKSSVSLRPMALQHQPGASPAAAQTPASATLQTRTICFPRMMTHCLPARKKALQAATEVQLPEGSPTISATETPNHIKNGQALGGQGARELLAQRPHPKASHQPMPNRSPRAFGNACHASASASLAALGHREQPVSKKTMDGR